MSASSCEPAANRCEQIMGRLAIPGASALPPCSMARARVESTRAEPSLYRSAPLCALLASICAPAIRKLRSLLEVARVDSSGVSRDLIPIFPLL